MCGVGGGGGGVVVEAEVLLGLVSSHHQARESEGRSESGLLQMTRWVPLGVIERRRLNEGRRLAGGLLLQCNVSAGQYEHPWSSC